MGVNLTSGATFFGRPAQRFWNAVYTAPGFPPEGRSVCGMPAAAATDGRGGKLLPCSHALVGSHPRSTPSSRFGVVNVTLSTASSLTNCWVRAQIWGWARLCGHDCDVAAVCMLRLGVTRQNAGECSAGGSGPGMMS